MSLHLNPEYDRLLPRMSEEEFDQLKESIRTEGQHYPIIVNQDLVVLDGHHRYRACIELDIEPDFEVKQFEDKLIEKKFVIEANLRRRHLNNFQLVELAVPLLEIEKSLAKQRQKDGGKNGRDAQLESGLASDDAEPELEPQFKAKAAEVVAKKAGVSTRTLERGKKILEKASEEDKQALRDGKTSISHVYQEIVREEKPPQPVEEQPPVAAEPEGSLHNRLALMELLERLEKEELYCPSCGAHMLECSSCHKTLRQMIKEQIQNGA